jgi:hypothetical protein
MAELRVHGILELFVERTALVTVMHAIRESPDAGRPEFSVHDPILRNFDVSKNLQGGVDHGQIYSSHGQVGFSVTSMSNAMNHNVESERMRRFLPLISHGIVDYLHYKSDHDVFIFWSMRLFVVSQRSPLRRR